MRKSNRIFKENSYSSDNDKRWTGNIKCKSKEEEARKLKRTKEISTYIYIQLLLVNFISHALYSVMREG